MKNSSIKKNFVLYTCFRILNIITPLITAPYIARVLGVKLIGRFSYAYSIVAYFVLFATLGTSVYGQREISYCQEDKEKRSVAFWSIEIISIFSTLCSLIIYYVFIVRKSNDFLLYIILSLGILNVLFDTAWVYQGMEDFSSIFVKNATVKIVSIIAIFVFVKSKEDLYIYTLIHVLSTLLGSISLWIPIKKYVSLVDVHKLEIKKHIPGLISLFIPTIATTLYSYIDKTMIGMFSTDSVENGYYEQAYKISTLTQTLVTSVGAVMFPRIGACFKDNNEEKIKDYMYTSYRFVSLLGFPLCFGIIGISKNFVPWFFGPGYEGTIPILMVLAFHNIVIAYSNVGGVQYLIPTRQHNKYTITVFIGSITNILLNSILIPLLFGVGAAFASILSESVVVAVQIVMIKKLINYKKIAGEVYKYLIFSIIMFLCVYFISGFLSSSFFNTMILIIVGFIIYSTFLVLTKDPFVNQIIDIIKKKRIIKGNKL